MKYSGIGGQAVIEGIMMMKGEDYAVAVRRPDKEIEVKKRHIPEYHEKSEDFTAPVCARRVPVCRFDDHRHAESVVFRQRFLRMMRMQSRENSNSF